MKGWYISTGMTGFGSSLRYFFSTPATQWTLCELRFIWEGSSTVTRKKWINILTLGTIAGHVNTHAFTWHQFILWSEKPGIISYCKVILDDDLNTPVNLPILNSILIVLISSVLANILYTLKDSASVKKESIVFMYTNGASKKQNFKFFFFFFKSYLAHCYSSSDGFADEQIGHTVFSGSGFLHIGSQARWIWKLWIFRIK